MPKLKKAKQINNILGAGFENLAAAVILQAWNDWVQVFEDLRDGSDIKRQQAESTIIEIKAFLKSGWFIWLCCNNDHDVIRERFLSYDRERT